MRHHCPNISRLLRQAQGDHAVANVIRSGYHHSKETECRRLPNTFQNLLGSADDKAVGRKCRTRMDDGLTPYYKGSCV